VENVTTWKASVTPTGDRGNVNYQVAIPWKDMGIDSPKPSQTISFAAVVNDYDTGEVPGGAGWGRSRIRWFGGIDGDKNPEAYGDITLVEPAAKDSTEIGAR
jgi:hypothetical protein